jgi:hypothetical protein
MGAHVAQIGEGYRGKNIKVKFGKRGRIILKLIFRDTGCESMDWFISLKIGSSDELLGAQ